MDLSTGPPSSTGVDMKNLLLLLKLLCAVGQEDNDKFAATRGTPAADADGIE